MDTIFADLKYAVRRLARQPGFAAAAVLTLALGTGANIALFSVLNSVMLRRTPGVAEPERLVALYTSDFSGPAYGGSSYPDYEAMAATEVFSAAAAYQPQVASVGEAGATMRIGLELVTSDYFTVLGMTLRGRAFDATSDEDAVVISDAFWRTRYGGAQSAVGSRIRINDRAATVIGIAPPGFRGSVRGIATDVWMPLAAGARFGFTTDLASRGDHGYMVVARMRDGITIEQVTARMRVLAAELHAAHPQAWTDVRGEARRLSVLEEKDARVPPIARGPVLGFAALLSAMVGLVLLICCANLAGLMLARVAARQREIAIRLSIGATQGRIKRLLLTESLLLSAAGTVVGLLSAIWVVDALLALLPSNLPVPVALEVVIDARVTAFAVAIAVLSALLFGAAPALRASRSQLSFAIRDATASFQRGGRLSLRGALVAMQVAASVVLMVSALLFLRGLRATADVELGFSSEDVVLVDLEARSGIDASGDVEARTTHEIVNRLLQVPAVQAASWAWQPPLTLGATRINITIDGYVRAAGEDMEHHVNSVGPDYFETMRLPVVRGRGITAADGAAAPGVMVVNEAFGRRFFPGQDVLGRRVSLSGSEGPFLTIVGVARDAKMVNVATEVAPYMFTASLQHPRGAVLHVRTTLEPAQLLQQVRGVAAQVAPSWEVRNARTMEAQAGVAVLPQRVASRVLGAFGVLAMLLAAMGLYGVLAFTVAQRTREVGIRIALGATAASVVALTVREGLRVVLIGLGAGVLLAAAITRLTASLLLGTSPLDPASYGISVLLLLVVTALAMYLPARGAARIDPLSALRAE